MHCFKDSQGRDWQLDITVASARTLRDALGVNVYAMPQEKWRGLLDLLGDPFAMIDVAWVLCRREAAERKIDQAAFEGAIDGEALERLGKAFLAGFPDFFSDAQLRANVRSLLAKTQRVAERAHQRDAQKLATLDAETANLDELEAKGRALLAAQTATATANASPMSSRPTSGSVPPSSASTPAPSPSPNSP